MHQVSLAVLAKTIHVIFNECQRSFIWCFVTATIMLTRVILVKQKMCDVQFKILVIVDYAIFLSFAVHKVFIG